MIVNLNSKPTKIPDDINSLEELLQFLNIRKGGTAVAVNNKLIVNSKWASTALHEGDSVTIISAAFGG